MSYKSNSCPISLRKAYILYVVSFPSLVYLIYTLLLPRNPTALGKYRNCSAAHLIINVNVHALYLNLP